MDYILCRRSFCEKSSECLINLLNQKYSVQMTFDKCFIQRIRHSTLRRIGDFQIIGTFVKILENKYSVACKSSTFCHQLGEVLNLLIKTSQTWNISLTSWKEHDGGFLLNVDRLQAFSYIIPKTLSPQSDTVLTPESDKILLICHVNSNPGLHDLRTLLHCEILWNHFKGKCEVFLSKDIEDHNECLYQLLIRKLNLNMNASTPTVAEDYDGNKLDIPTHFADCLQDEDRVYTHLQTLHRHGTRTAFASRIVNYYKNITCHQSKHLVSQSLKGALQCIHVCNHTNTVLAQQTELFHAWYKDMKHPDLRETVVPPKCDTYLTHSGIRSKSTSNALEFLKSKREQIKESYESKLQISADDEQWEIVFNKMRAAMVRLEFLKNSASSPIKLDSASSADAIFILYNYSRISTLLEAYYKKVQDGCYPDSILGDVDFKFLQEDAEWELLIDHLWTFQDVTEKLIPIFKEHKLIEYLRQLCHSISTYYSRYHILVEGLPHLIPTVTARIFLMKTAKSVMDHVFQLIGVEPVSQM